MKKMRVGGLPQPVSALFQAESGDGRVL